MMNHIRIYNTLTRKKELLKPIADGHIRLYVCGITSYDWCHIGHARSALVFDMAVRYLRWRGFKVTFVRNFTDIDDKIINRANEQGLEPQALAERFINEFYTDMDALGVQRADIEPKATEHISEMIELVQQLIDRGLAYAAGGDVYYRVRSFPDYGCLSGRKFEEMQVGARVDVNEQKEDPMDFVLWKGAKPGEPKWPSPWGEGRPGWHIECSAMSRKYLGATFDMHGGGQDLIFPHHENEIAQSVGANGQPFAKIWMHHGFVTVKDEKMSKSLGNFLTIREVLKQWPAEVLRLFLFSTQYRNPLDYNEAALRDAEAGLERMYSCLAKIAALPEFSSGTAPLLLSQKDKKTISSLREQFAAAMDNDFNTAQAIGHLFDAVKVLNKAARLLLDQPGNAEELALVRQGAADLRKLAGLLGLLGQDAAAYLRRKKEHMLALTDLSEEEINALIAKRNEARIRKDWAASDAVRDELLAHKIELQDGPDGTSWQIKAYQVCSATQASTNEARSRKDWAASDAVRGRAARP